MTNKERVNYKVISIVGDTPENRLEKLHYSGPNRETALGMYKRLTLSPSTVKGFFYEDDLLIKKFHNQNK